jgi:hypothetical protein
LHSLYFKNPCAIELFSLECALLEIAGSNTRAAGLYDFIASDPIWLRFRLVLSGLLFAACQVGSMTCNPKRAHNRRTTPD